MFITFEAPEGAGKTTQVQRLHDRLKTLGLPVVRTREPGGSAGAEDIRRLVVEGDPDRWSAITELLLFTAARRDHVEKTLRPLLECGHVVLCDRYDGSTYALQGAAGVADEKIALLQREFIGLQPDLTIFLDIDYEISLTRSRARLVTQASSEDRFENKKDAFHRAVYDRLQHLASTRTNWIRVDAHGEIAEVEDRIWNALQSDSRFAAHLNDLVA